MPGAHLFLAVVAFQGCPPPGGGGDGGDDGGDDGGGVDAGCVNGFCTFTLDPAGMALISDFTPQIAAALGPNDRIGIVYLKADKDLEYGEVMKVMDLAREAGVEEIALIAEQKVQG